MPIPNYSTDNSKAKNCCRALTIFELVLRIRILKIDFLHNNTLHYGHKILLLFLLLNMAVIIVIC